MKPTHASGAPAPFDLEGLLASPEVGKARRIIAKVQKILAQKQAHEALPKFAEYIGAYNACDALYRAKFSRLNRGGERLRRTLNSYGLIRRWWRESRIDSWYWKAREKQFKEEAKAKTEIKKRFKAEALLEKAAETLRPLVGGLHTPFPPINNIIYFPDVWFAAKIYGYGWYRDGWRFYYNKAPALYPSRLKEFGNQEVARSFLSNIDIWSQHKCFIGAVFGSERISQVEENIRTALVSLPFDEIDGRLRCHHNEKSIPILPLVPLKIAKLHINRIIDFVLEMNRYNNDGHSVTDFKPLHTIHAFGWDYASHVEDFLVLAFIRYRLGPRDRLGELMAEQMGLKFWENRDSLSATHCLSFLQELAPDKAARFEKANPYAKIKEFADAIHSATLAELRALPEDTRFRALTLLGHFKFASTEVAKSATLAIAALSFTTPLRAEQRTKLRSMADQFLDHVGTSEALQQESMWENASFEERKRITERNYAKACESFGLPLREILCLDEPMIEEVGERKTLGSNDGLSKPIQVAIGKGVSYITVMESVAHEAWHDEHDFISRYGLNPSSPQDGILFMTQRDMGHFDPPHIAGQDPSCLGNDLRHAFYRTRLHERESHYLGQCIREKLTFISGSVRRTSAARYLARALEKMELQVGTLLYLAEKENTISKDFIAESRARLELFAIEEPVIDVCISRNGVRILDTARPIEAQTLTIHHLRVMESMGYETVQLRVPQEHSNALKELVKDMPVREPRAPASTLSIPTVAALFDFPERPDAPAATSTALVRFNR